MLWECALWLVGDGRLNGVPGAEDFGDRPGLGDASAWGERRLAVKDFSQRAKSVIVEMMSHRSKIRQSRFGMAIHAMVGERERTEEPAPDGALMIGAIPLPDISFILSYILGIFLP